MIPERVRGRAVAALYTLALAGCTAANASGQTPGVQAMSAGRILAIVAALVGLTGVVIGGRALRSPDPLGSGRRAIVAMVAGLVAVALGGLVAGTAAGGVGTGNGVGGAIVAVLVGLVGLVLGGLALARSRRTRVTG